MMAKAKAKKTTPRAWSLAAWLAEARKLREDVFSADVRFHLHLVEGERASFWHGAHTTFGQFMEENHLGCPTRFGAFRDALKVIAVADALKAGVDSTIKAARIQDDSRRAGVVSHLIAKTEERGFPLSAREVERVVREADPAPPRPPSTVRRGIREQRLTEENRALRRELARLEEENVRLRKQLVELEGSRGAAE